MISQRKTLAKKPFFTIFLCPFKAKIWASYHIPLDHREGKTLSFLGCPEHLLHKYCNCKKKTKAAFWLNISSFYYAIIITCWWWHNKITIIISLWWHHKILKYWATMKFSFSGVKQPVCLGKLIIGSTRSLKPGERSCYRYTHGQQTI